MTCRVTSVGDHMPCALTVHPALLIALSGLPMGTAVLTALLKMEMIATVGFQVTMASCATGILGWQVLAKTIAFRMETLVHLDPMQSGPT